MKVLKTVLIMAMAALIFIGPRMSMAARAQYDNFVLLIDQSGEMDKNYDKKSMNFIARNVAERILNNIPTSVPVQGAMYMYGIMAKDEKNMVLTVRELEAFNVTRFQRDLAEKVGRQSGPSSLSKALERVREDLQGKPGRTAVIIISGGNLTDVGKPSDQAIQLKRGYGENVCIYTILVGKSKRGGEFLSELVEKGGCGFTANADNLHNGIQVQTYVNLIFFGSAGDADRDGVGDRDDQCPNTPFGASVDFRGCWVLNNINFDSGKSEIKSQYYGLLNEVASVMVSNPDLQVMIEGHTDSDGDDAYNQKLSEQRANSVMSFLVQSGADPFKMRAVGMGESRPVASNATPQGKAQNRRIEFVVSKK